MTSDNASTLFETDVTPVQWLAKIESGDVARHSHKLCNTHGDRFCCLGVLANMMGTLQTNLNESTPDGQVAGCYSCNIPASLSPEWLTQGMQDALAERNDTLYGNNPDWKKSSLIADHNPYGMLSVPEYIRAEVIPAWEKANEEQTT